MENIANQITLLLQDVVQYVNFLVGGNEFASGLILTTLMTASLYLMRTIPSSVWEFIKKHAMTTLTINNNHAAFEHLSEYLIEKGITNSSRYLKVSNKSRNRHIDITSEGKHLKEIGYGEQLFWFNWYTPCFIDIDKEDSTASKVKEFITIKKFGRSHKFFDSIIETLSVIDEDTTQTKFYEIEYDTKSYITSQDKRTLDSIVLPKKDLDYLLGYIKKFKKSEGWYKKHQIPYQLGILLYGPPGTGKTSIIKALAAHLNKNILFTKTIEELQTAAKTIKDEIIVVEEIDTLPLGKREDDDKTSVSQSLGMILNALDGVITNHGRIIIVTTNFIDNLDAALIRPGRIDIKLHVDYLTTETFNTMMAKFYDNYKEFDYNIKDKKTPAQLQNDIIAGLTIEELIEKYTHG